MPTQWVGRERQTVQWKPLYLNNTYAINKQGLTGKTFIMVKPKDMHAYLHLNSATACGRLCRLTNAEPDQG